MSLQFDINVVSPKDVDQLFCTLSPRNFSAFSQCCCERTLLAPGKAKQPVMKIPQIIQRGRALALRLFSHFESSNQLAKILIPSP